MIRRIQLAIALLTIGLAAGAFFVGTPRDAYSVLAAGALVVLNLFALEILTRPVRKRLAAGAPAGRSPGVLLAVLLVLKMLVLFLAVYVLLRYRLVAPIAFAVGLTTLPAGAFLGSLFGRSSAVG